MKWTTSLVVCNKTRSCIDSWVAPDYSTCSMCYMFCCTDERTHLHPVSSVSSSSSPSGTWSSSAAETNCSHARTLQLRSAEWWELIRVPRVCGVIKTVFEGLNIRLASLGLYFVISLSSLVAFWLWCCCFYYFITFFPCTFPHFNECLFVKWWNNFGLIAPR